MGLFFACIYMVWQIIFSEQIFASIFVSAMGFLFNWYIVTGILIVPISLLFALGILGGSTIAGGANGGKLGGLMGFLGGGAIGGLVLFITTLKRAALVGIAYMLSTKAVMIPAEGLPVWNWPVLIIGLILLLVFSRSGRSSSSSSS